MDWQKYPRCDQAPAWQALQAHFSARFAGARAFDLRQAFAQDSRRAADFFLQAPHVQADLSKCLLDRTARALLVQLAHECGLQAHRDALLQGQRVNNTEERAALHPLLRWPAGQPPDARVAQDAQQKLAQDLHEMLSFAEQTRAQKQFSDVLHIGIGGSDLGPRVALQALSAGSPPGPPQGPRVHFVANMDGHELAAALRTLRAQTTLFVVASKSFGTAETLQNAASARAWFLAQGGQDVARHFVAITAKPQAARALGIARCLHLDEGVGGRYSLWSAIGLPVALAFGAATFEALLAGAHAMDTHFAEAPLEVNLPAQLGLLDVWYRNFHHFPSRCVVPYHHGLRRLTAYLQQLEMESNGKRVDAHGLALPFDTSPVLWGDVGSNSQHAFFQMLHQGTQAVPVEFIAAQHAAHGLPGHQRQLLANVLAQARALMLGQSGSDGHRHFPGNRPSTLLMLPRLDAPALGALLALCEHRVFVSGSLWGINSFDQWGVELGKHHARDIEAQLQGQAASAPSDPSTALWVQRLQAPSQ
ncbi:MAG: glucose-6-phosphate isomerase [Burkholderiaceae bacterium]|jgi:glucose-6-phosphate isomerase|nr:glucose-6-phosphate isomerase [Burkholderiaceae bacterium]